METLAVLKQYFGYDTFRASQEAVIQHILAGDDVLALMPTGGGKSLCYQLSALIMEGVTIVVSPLISLMQDQVSALDVMGIPAAYINSTLSYQQRRDIFERARSNAFKLLYVAPEQLMTESFLKLSQDLHIAQVSVDEAHCVSQWGKDFRPDYLMIHDYIRQLTTRPVISAFTATATQQVQEDIIHQLKLNHPHREQESFDRPNLFFRTLQLSTAKKTQWIKEWCKKNQESGIIYCQTRKEVERLTESLKQEGIQVGMYHAGLPKEMRMRNQEQFTKDQLRIIVATNAFGMGIDKSNVGFVVHHNMPGDLESYYQEAGRAGRDGSHAECTLLFNGEDIRMHHFFIDHMAEDQENMDEASRKQIKKRARLRLLEMRKYCLTHQCLRKTMLEYFGEEASQSCESCGNCLQHFERTDLTQDVQKILSCILRMEERFGKTKTIAVLMGKNEASIREQGLDRLSTFGIMKQTKKEHIERVIDYLMGESYIDSDPEYQTLSVSNKGRKFIKQRESLIIPFPQTNQGDASLHDKGDEAAELSSFERQLFEKLKALRLEFAQEANLPAYVIFNNKTLIDMCIQKPTTIQDFSKVKGVGYKKMEQFGSSFIELIRETVGN